MATSTLSLSNADLANDYEHLFDICRINPGKYQFVTNTISDIQGNETRYQNLGNRLGIPWYFIGIIHYMEASLDFNCHLHNGDPLAARTVNVPFGRPADSNPPFTWEVSAADALQLMKLDKWSDWSIPGILFQFELYNGMGYRRRGINSPYVWSFSNNYSRGKFTSDGIFDPNAVSKQCGAGVLLRRMKELQLITDPTTDRIATIKNLGSQVAYSGAYSDKAEQLQILLNSVGATLRVDGEAGDKTSQAYKNISGNYLTGDPRIH
ncbi:MAG: hypothetical protein C5B52_07275 [Bacteroidetes bacterium]|nr:MAG: hypothetical protein C5B52_07275 [Bacteroidota bacterium]